MKEKKMIVFPTYLPNPKIQGSGTANKQFFKDGLRAPMNTIVELKFLLQKI